MLDYYIALAKLQAELVELAENGEPPNLTTFILLAKLMSEVEELD